MAMRTISAVDATLSETLVEHDGAIALAIALHSLYLI